jgi:endoglucanase
MVVLRRRSLGVFAAVALWGSGRTTTHAELGVSQPVPNATEWALFRERFITPGGRTVDTGNGGASHSEGQGWALLMAEAHDDRATFDRVLSWTRRELKRPYDSLHAWRWMPGRPVAIEDGNNATDGDIFIAWALTRAARRWNRPELEELSAALRADLVRLCVREVAGRTVLLPAASGFERRDQVVVNPSYYVFRAFADFGAIEGEGSPWTALHRDGLTMLQEARFGRWGLPADWLQLSRQGGRPMPATGWAPRFSYDAMRVPLYLAWSGLAQEPAARAANAFWNWGGLPYRPAWTEFSGDKLAPYPLGPSQRAIAALVQSPVGPVDLPSVRDAEDYYAAALVMLSHVALAERLPLAG